MKTIFFKRISSFLSIFTLILIVSCSDDNTVNKEPEPDLSEIKLAMEIDEIETLTTDFVITAFEIQQTSEVGRTSQRFNNLPNCIAVSILVEQNYREITLDFGNGECTVNGREIQGTLNLSYNRSPDNSNILITASSNNLYINGRLLEGTRTILREFVNENGNPQFTHTANITVTWPNGVIVSREGVVVREWIEGFDTADLNDNVFQITGNWKVSFSNNNRHFYETITPLRREFGCRHLVSGTLDIERSLFGGELDFGNGNCDNLATFTFDNGETWDVVLN